MSRNGPTISLMSEKNVLESLSSSCLDRSFGLTVTPPFAPPNGMPATAHFHVIHIDNAFTSSIVTLEWYLILPFLGPDALFGFLMSPGYSKIQPSTLLT